MPVAKNGPWEADHKYSERFEDRKFVAALLAYTVAEAVAPETKAPKVPTDVAPFIASLYRFPLLTLEGTWMLFMKMNYAKWKANQLRQQIEAGSRKHGLQEQYRKFLAVAQTARNDIANHNMRLVASLAKKQKKPGMGLEEWISNGNLSLLKAIDKFDCNKPNPYKPDQFIRFSTYATWAITKNFWRDHCEMNASRERVTDELAVDELPLADPSSLESVEDPLNEDVLQLLQNMESLPPREQRVLKGRYGMGRDNATLDRLGVELNVTKERVRQIQKAAIRRLKTKLGVPWSEQDHKEALAKKIANSTYRKPKLTLVA